MLTDTLFAPMNFPQLRDDARERVEAAARASGHAVGYLEGLRLAALESAERQERRDVELAEIAHDDRKRVDAALTAMAAATHALRECTVPLLLDAQGTLVAASIDIAEAVLGHELARGEVSARSALERALSGVDATTVQVVRMNPADLDLLDRATRAVAAVDFRADSSLLRGEAITEFADGFLDARITAAVARVRSALGVTP